MMDRFMLRRLAAEIIEEPIMSEEARQMIARCLRMVANDPCLLKVEDKEPMFVLLARDSTAPEVMLEWCRQRSKEIRIGVRPNTIEERDDIEQVMRKVNDFAMWHLIERTLPMPGDQES